MRAFLSTGAGHHPVDGSRYTCGFNVESALSEARAILAETEHGLCYRLSPVPALGPLVRQSRVAAAALAESLRAFVEA